MDRPCIFCVCVCCVCVNDLSTSQHRSERQQNTITFRSSEQTFQGKQLEMCLESCGAQHECNFESVSILASQFASQKSGDKPLFVCWLELFHTFHPWPGW